MLDLNMVPWEIQLEREKYFLLEKNTKLGKQTWFFSVQEVLKDSVRVPQDSTLKKGISILYF